MEKVNFYPSEDRLLIKVDQAEEKTESGLYKPASAIEEPNTGVIWAAGPGKYALNTGALIPMNVAIGDRVLFEKHNGRDIQLDGVAYKVLRSGELIGRL